MRLHGALAGDMSQSLMRLRAALNGRLDGPDCGGNKRARQADRRTNHAPGVAPG